MKALLLLLLTTLTAWAMPPVAIYSGTSVESRPGERGRPQRVFFVYGGPGGRGTVMVRSGHFFVVQMESGLGGQTIRNADGRAFMVLHSVPQSESAGEPLTYWQFTSEVSRNLAATPRRLTGRISAIKSPFIALAIIDPVTGTSPVSRPASFSERRFTLTLDRARTDDARQRNLSYDDVLAILQRAR